jgi:hypothetical protein
MKPELWESFGGVRGVSMEYGTRKGMKEEGRRGGSRTAAAATKRDLTVEQY